MLSLRDAFSAVNTNKVKYEVFVQFLSGLINILKQIATMFEIA